MYIFDVFTCLALAVAFFQDKALLILGLAVARSLYPRYCYSKTKHAARPPHAHLSIVPLRPTPAAAVRVSPPPPPPQVMLLPPLAAPLLLLHPLAAHSVAARELWPGAFGRPPSIPSPAAVVAPSRRKVTGLPLVSTPDRGHHAIPPPRQHPPRAALPRCSEGLRISYG